jgi:hypothetical protein
VAVAIRSGRVNCDVIGDSSDPPSPNKAMISHGRFDIEDGVGKTQHTTHYCR